jgi:hypothetical protein
VADLLRGGIAINEVLVDPNGATAFDTDGNGTAAATDEFIELVNTSDSAISIAGLQLWDQGNGNWFTFPAGAVLQPGAHAVVITGLQSGGSLPTGGPDDLFYSAGRNTAVINNGGDNLVVLDPSANEYIIATFNGDVLDNPPADYTGFPSSATQIGAGEDFGYDIDGYSIQRASNGSGSFVNNQTPTPGTHNVCFTAGTRVQTPRGPVAIETLQPDDLVMTRDNGPQPVVWVWSKTHRPDAMARNQRLCPVRIARHALGNGLPVRDLYVSQQHRVLIASRIAERIFGETEVLVAAKDLVALAGVEVVLPAQELTYIHLLMNGHEIVLAEGAPSESMYLGPQALRVMDGAMQAEVKLLLGVTQDVFPQAAHQPARLFAVGKMARQLVARHMKNSKALLASDVAPLPA